MDLKHKTLNIRFYVKAAFEISTLNNCTLDRKCITALDINPRNREVAYTESFCESQSLIPSDLSEIGGSRALILAV